MDLTSKPYGLKGLSSSVTMYPSAALLDRLSLLACLDSIELRVTKLAHFRALVLLYFHLSILMSADVEIYLTEFNIIETLQSFDRTSN